MKKKGEKPHTVNQHMTFWKDKAMETVQRSVVARSRQGEKRGKNRPRTEDFKTV